MPRLRRELVRLAAITSVAVTAAVVGCGGSSDAEDRARALADQAALEVNGVLTDSRSLLMELSVLPGVRNHDAVACNLAAAHRVASLDDYSALGAADANGDLWCLSIPMPEPVNISDRAYFIVASDAHEFSVGDYQLGRVTGVESLGTGYPVDATNGRRAGIVLAPILLDSLADRLEAVDLPEGADLIVTDAHGTVVARLPDRSSIGHSLEGTPLAEAMLEGTDGSGDFTVDGAERTYAYATPSEAPDSLRIAVGVSR